MELFHNPYPNILQEKRERENETRWCLLPFLRLAGGKATIFHCII